MKNCPYCNSPMQENAEFCLHCMKSAKAKRDVTPEKKDPSKKALIIPLCIVSALLLIFISGFAYFFVYPRFAILPQKNDKPAKKTEKTENTTDIDHSEDTGKTETTYNFLFSGDPEDSSEKKPDTETDPKPVQKETSPSACTGGHSWKAITKTIHHDETGHYENTLIGYKTVITYKCPLCYKDPFETLELYYEHYSSHISYEGDPAGMLKERYEVISESVPVYDEKWVVDSPAYDEEITVNYVCTVCNKEKEN